MRRIGSTTSGEVKLQGISLDSLDEDNRAKVRNEHVGFVFQTFQLVPTLTAIENIMVPLELRVFLQLLFANGQNNFF